MIACPLCGSSGASGIAQLISGDGQAGGEAGVPAISVRGPVQEVGHGSQLIVVEGCQVEGCQVEGDFELGAEIAVEGILTPHIVGQAARTGWYDSQALKRVWHYLAWFGAPWAQA